MERWSADGENILDGGGGSWRGGDKVMVSGVPW